MTNTPNYGLPLMDAASASKSIDFNSAMAIIDALIGRGLVDTTLTAPPGSPAEGFAWGVAAAASGDWLGYDGDIALFLGGGWVFVTPPFGPQYNDLANSYLATSDGTGWFVSESGTGGILDKTGARVLADVYQNTSLSPLFVWISHYDNNDGNLTSFEFQTSPDNSVWTMVARSHTANSDNDGNIFGLVPDNHYYRFLLVSGGNSALKIAAWYEQIQG